MRSRVYAKLAYLCQLRMAVRRVPRRVSIVAHTVGRLKPAPPSSAPAPRQSVYRYWRPGAAGGVAGAVGIGLGGRATTPFAASSTETLLLYRICPVARSSSTLAFEYAASAAIRFDSAVTRSRSARITL